MLLLLKDVRGVLEEEKLACFIEYEWSWGAKRFGCEFSSSSNVVHLLESCFSMAVPREFSFSPIWSLNSFLTTSKTASPFRSHHDLEYPQNIRGTIRTC